MAYNRFGALYTAPIALYPGTALADFGTQAVVEEAIDRAVDRIANAMSEEVYSQLTEPRLELVVRRGTAGQTTATLGLIPVVSGSLHLWSGQPRTFQTEPQQTTDLRRSDDLSTAVEMASALFSVVLATGVVTFPALLANDQVYASYQADTASASYSIPSLARLAVRGAAAELGARLYTESNQEWGLVARYREDFEDTLDRLAAGKWVPDELRALRWWDEVAPASSTAGSVRLGRG